ncbi:MAG: hypothetical protein WCT30_08280, partial [Desulfurivibrionaceae bacterium]
MPEIMGVPPGIFAQRIRYYICLSAFLASSFIFVGGNGTALQVYLKGIAGPAVCLEPFLPMRLIVFCS